MLLLKKTGKTLRLNFLAHRLSKKKKGIKGLIPTEQLKKALGDRLLDPRKTYFIKCLRKGFDRQRTLCVNVHTFDHEVAYVCVKENQARWLNRGKLSFNKITQFFVAHTRPWGVPGY